MLEAIIRQMGMFGTGSAYLTSVLAWGYRAQAAAEFISSRFTISFHKHGRSIFLCLNFARKIPFLCRIPKDNPFSDPVSLRIQQNSLKKCDGGTFAHPLLEGDETRRVGGTDTGATVLDGLAVAIVSQLLLLSGLLSHGETY